MFPSVQQHVILAQELRRALSGICGVYMYWVCNLCKVRLHTVLYLLFSSTYMHLHFH